MRLYFNLCKAVVENLEEIFDVGNLANQVIEKKLRTDRRWGSRDRRFVAETTYDIVRYVRLYAFSSGQELDSVNNWWQVLAGYLFHKEIDIPEWDEFENIDKSDFEERIEDGSNIRKVRESIPDWLDELGEKELGEKWDKTISSLNEPSKLVVRANLLKTNQLQLKKKLKKIEIDSETIGATGLILSQRKNLKNAEIFRKGFFEFQDYSSQQVSEFLEVTPGMTVIDACSGAGGKTLHLANLMDNQGRLIALDINQNKQKELLKRAKRAGANLTAELIDSNLIKQKYFAKADRLLLDAPCSGLGVLKRDPAAKWHLSLAFIDKIKETQRAILQDYSKMVKVGGKMVYATCSILPSENEKQVQHFLNANKNFKLEKEKSILPQDEGFDGFYMARMIRNS